MTYGQRLAMAACLAAVLHGAALALLGRLPEWRAPAPEAIPEPIVFNLQPEPVRRLIDQEALSEEPVAPTDLIAEHNAKAQDMTDEAGSEAAPRVPHTGEFDQASRPASAAVQPRQAAPVTPQSASLPEPEKAPAPRQETESTAASEAPAVTAKPPTPDKKREARDPRPERFEMAQVQPVPPQPSTPETAPKEARGRVEGNAMRKGFLAFEAMADDVAPYLRDVRRRVETRWRAALHLRYSGTTATRAVLDCAIAPDGTLAYVRIVDSGGSPTYAALCREAIERAGPFPPFPFQVPDMYREKNLEIRWTFSFL